MDDENVERSISSNNNDPNVPMKIELAYELVFYVSPQIYDAAAAKLLSHDGLKITDAEFNHKPAIKWVITD